MFGLEPTFGFAILFKHAEANTLFVQEEEPCWPYFVQSVVNYQVGNPLGHVLTRFAIRTDRPDTAAAHTTGRRVAQAVYNSLTPARQEEIWRRTIGQDPGAFARFDGRVPNLNWPLTRKDDEGSMYFPHYNIGTLSAFITSFKATGTRLPRTLVLRFLVEMMEALEAVHGACEGLCDIPKALSPDNIWVHRHFNTYDRHCSFYLGPGCSGWDDGGGGGALPDTLGDGEDVFAGVFTELQTSPDDDLVLGTLSYIISKLIRLNANFLQQDDAGSVQGIVYPKLGNLAAIGRMLLDRGGAKNVQYGIVLAPRRNDLASMTPRIYKTAAEAWAASEALGG
ncbi:hypothetical protein RB597_001217 [Gaeumannomyces tritici]